MVVRVLVTILLDALERHGVLHLEEFGYTVQGVPPLPKFPVGTGTMMIQLHNEDMAVFPERCPELLAMMPHVLLEDVWL